MPVGMPGNWLAVRDLGPRPVPALDASPSRYTMIRGGEAWEEWLTMETGWEGAIPVQGGKQFGRPDPVLLGKNYAAN